MTEDEIRDFLKKVLNSPGSQDNHIEIITDMWVDAQYEFSERKFRDLNYLLDTMDDD